MTDRRTFLIGSLGLGALITMAYFAAMVLMRKSDAEKLLDVIKANHKADAAWAVSMLFELPALQLEPLLQYVEVDTPTQLTFLAWINWDSSKVIIETGQRYSLGEVVQFVLSGRLKRHRGGLLSISAGLNQGEDWETLWGGFQKRAPETRDSETESTHLNLTPPSQRAELIGVERDPQRLIETLQSKSKSQTVWAAEALKQVPPTRIEGLFPHLQDIRLTSIDRLQADFGSSYRGGGFTVGEVLRFTLCERMGIRDPEAWGEGAIAKIKKRWKDWRKENP